jgi:hypothetical protein
MSTPDDDLREPLEEKILEQFADGRTHSVDEITEAVGHPAPSGSAGGAPDVGGGLTPATPDAAPASGPSPDEGDGDDLADALLFLLRDWEEHQVLALMYDLGAGGSYEEAGGGLAGVETRARAAGIQDYHTP